ncbi:Uncharacterised protein [Klebsiella pneumoniae]|uniref:Uncharacterized protein n=1 Tax=Klebsiella pneumoniae TaxID=573 RepID=A0A377TV42_KLEPN|nr:Uncharacterised protein [Klebsiella pneumoniae]
MPGQDYKRPLPFGSLQGVAQHRQYLLPPVPVARRIHRMDDDVATGSRRRDLAAIQRVAGYPLYAIFGITHLGAALQRPNLPVVCHQPARHFPADAPPLAPE